MIINNQGKGETLASLQKSVYTSLIFCLGLSIFAGQPKSQKETGPKITRQEIIDDYPYQLTVAENAALMQTKTRLEAAKIVQSLYYERLSASIQELDHRVDGSESEVKKVMRDWVNYAMQHGEIAFKAAIERGRKLDAQYKKASELVDELRKFDQIKSKGRN